MCKLHSEDNIDFKMKDICENDSISQDEIDTLMNKYSGVAYIKSTELSIIDLFNKRVKEFSSKVALDSLERCYTYGEIDELSNDLACQLIERGITYGDVVGIFMKRSPLLVICQLAVLKANATYLPLDPAYPAERLQFMIEDSCAKIILKDNSDPTYILKYEKLFYETKFLNNKIEKEKFFNTKVETRTAESSTYIIYTSGTTGKPKGVEVPDRGIVRLVNENHLYNVNSNDITMFSSSISFDASVFEIWGALLNGATLVVLPAYLPSLEQLAKLMNTKKISAPFITTSLFHQLIEHFPEAFNTVSRVWTGGEVISKNLVSKLLEIKPDVRIYNCYGPTENSVVTTIQEINSRNISNYSSSIPIGRPIPGTTTYVLDNNMNPVPIGSKGELYTGGIGIAKGYLNQSSLTEKVFVKNPFSKEQNSYLYKTGDIVRYTNSGEIEFIGRKDNQVKIRGYRIELGEIEMKLAQSSNVLSCVVEAIPNMGDEKVIVAYIVPKVKEEASENEYREELAQLLPSFMVPSHFIILDSFKLTSNGKIDKKSLPLPKAMNSNNEIVQEDEELSGREAYVRNLWENVLKYSSIHKSSNFFTIGGHSLYASIIIGKIRKETKLDVNVQDILENPVLKDFAERLDNCSEIIDYSFQGNSCEDKEAEEQLTNLSSAQERLYFLEKRGLPQIGVYNIPVAIKIQGVIDIDILRRSIGYIIDKHELLRSVIKSDDGQPKISILNESKIPFSISDLSKFHISESKQLAQKEISNLSKHTFNMEEGELFLAKLIKLSNDYSILVLVIHHIICDGWSLGIMLQDIGEYYNACKKGTDFYGIKGNAVFKDYVKYEKNLKEKLLNSGSIEFWKDELEGHSECLNLSLSSKRPKNMSFIGGWVERNLSMELSNKIRKFAQMEKVTVYSFLLSVFNVLLSKYADENDICIGTPFLNRTEDDFKNIIGFFANSVVIRNKVDGGSKFTEFLQKVHERTVQVFKHSHVPFEEVVRIAEKNRSNSYNPIFQYVFSHQDFTNLNLELEDATCELMSNESMGLENSKFDMSLFSIFKGDKLNLQLEYSTDVVNKDIASEFIDRFIYIVEKIISEPSMKISEIPLIDESEKLSIITKFNTTDSLYPREFSLAEIFRKVAEENLKNVAIVFEDNTYTYEQLNIFSDCLAIELKDKGVRNGDRVAICMERTPEQIISILGILKCGASYVPIDLNYPEERIEFMVSDTNAVLAITDSAFSSNAAKLNINTLLVNMGILEDLMSKGEYLVTDLDTIDSSQEAYVLYTSGSTGKPKGIMVPNHAITRLVLNTNYIPYKENSTYLHMASLSFDAATFEIWAPLLNGYKLVLYPGRIPEFEKLREILVKNKVTHCWLTAGLFNSLIDEDTSILHGVPYIFTGGEKISEEHVRKALKINEGQEIINCYGPTENTTFTTTFSSKNWNVTEEGFPIGYPISNTKCYILDEGKNPVPVGVTGDLYTAGDGLALGYLNNSKLTEDVFIDNPFEVGTVMYKTGDKARYRNDGAIEYIGRADDQVKIRGFRIELMEVEKALTKVELIANCVALVLNEENLGKKLVAYFTSISGEVVEEEMIRKELGKHLPEYMIPSAFVQLSKLPLNINGKIDKKKLPKVQWGKNNIKKEIERPSTPIEKEVCSICRELLNIKDDNIDIADEFFALGGHSLLVGKLVARLKKKFDVRIGIADIFSNSTLRGISNKIEELLYDGKNIINPVKKIGMLADKGELSFSQQRLWLFDQINPKQSLFNIPIMLELRGNLNIDSLERTINVLMDRHRSLRTNFSVENGKVVQEVRVHKYEKLKVICVDTRDKALLIASDESMLGFDLNHDTLIRHKLLKITNEYHILLVTMNHIISDGWSLEIYLKELSGIYNCFIRGEKYELKEIKYDYIDFTKWQKEKLSLDEAKHDIDELKEILEELPSSTTISCDFERTEKRDFIANREYIILNNETTRKIRKVAMSYGMSMNMILLASFHALIYRLTNQEKIVTGSPITNREGEEFDNVIGFFVNNLVNITEMNGEMTFEQLLSQVRRNSLQMYRLGYIPFEIVLDLAKQERRLDQTPIFQMMFNWIEDQTDKVTMDGLEGKIDWDALPGSKFDLTLYAKELEEGLKFDLVYDSKLFKKERMKLFLEDLEGLIHEFISSPDIKIIEPALRSSGNKVLPNINEKLNYSAVDTVIHRFEKNRIKNPDKIVIEYDSEKLSFQEIGDRSESYMKALVNAGFKPGDIIPILAERNPELVISIIAILKMGCCFSIIDGQLPFDRIKELVNITKSRGVIKVVRYDISKTVEGLSNGIKELSILDFSKNATQHDIFNSKSQHEREIFIKCTPEIPMCICFTSGSTGIPKAVVSSHAAVLQSLDWFIDEFSVQENERFANLSGVSHDPLIRDIFLPLCGNAKLFIPTIDQINRPAKLRNWMYENEINILAHITPSLADILSSTFNDNENLLNSIRLACFTGERLMRNSVVNFLKGTPKARIINFYGATEAPQVRSFVEINKEILNERETMPAGKGISDTQLLVINKTNKLCGIGEVGEICIRTPYLSYGYLNDEEATSRVFIRELENDSKVGIYKTGDFGRYLPSGNIQFEGRRDRQVKIRAYRVELDEIEKKMNNIPGVLKAVVKVQKINGLEDNIVAFFVPSGKQKISDKDIKNYLSQCLPHYMIPIGIKEIDTIPLTKNGKIDYRSLVFERAIPGTEEKIMPQTEVEELLCEIFSDILRIEGIGVNENFFDIGGNSLIAFQIIAQINSMLYMDLSLKDIFLHPSIETLAENIENLLLQEDNI